MKKTVITLISLYNDMMQPRVEEVGISLVAAYARKMGFDVTLKASGDKNFDYSALIQRQPDLIGFNAYEVSLDSVDQVSARIKEVLPNVCIVVGGKYATISAVKVLKVCKAIDYVVCGDGEEPFAEIAECIEYGRDISQVDNITYRDNNGDVVEKPAKAIMTDLDKFPFAARDIMQENNSNIAFIYTTRGCMSNCSFCSAKMYSNLKKWHGRSPRNIIDEIEELFRYYNIRVFSFVDSSIEDSNEGIQRLLQIAREIINRGLNISYAVNVRSEIHRKLKVEDMELLIHSGLSMILMGAESADAHDLSLYHKIATVADNEACYQLFHKYGVVIHMGFINFNPYSTIERLRANLAFLKKFNYTPKFATRLFAYKGTQIHKKMSDEGLLTGIGYLDYRYQDARVGELSDYLFRYIDMINTYQNRLFETFIYYVVLFSFEMNYYKRFLFEQSVLCERVEDSIQLLEKETTQFSFDFGKYINLLLIATEESHMMDYEDISRVFMPISRILDFNNKCGNIKNRLRKDIIRMGCQDQLIDLLGI